MRLNRLDLTRYGKFTDHTLDFGALGLGRPDLHVVYGPNEAGKSTALAAFLDLLFGIETRTRFNFLHPNDTMRIGASLQIGNTDHELARVKRGNNTLLDGNGRPVAEALLKGQLTGIDRESYRSMFSLDDDTLEAGGESILASKGDLGQLLFSASAGLADLSRKLTELRNEADEFYRFHAHNTELGQFKKQLATLKEERERIDIAAPRYAALIDARDLALRQYESAIAERGAIQARMDEIRRQVSALPRFAALRAAREQLQPLAELPVAPSEWHETLPDLQKETVTLTVRGETLRRDLTETMAALDAIVLDETALEVAGRLDRLDILQARYVTADQDIPVRRLEAREADVQISGILGRLDRMAEPDPHRLLLAAAYVGNLQDLIARRSGVQSAAEAADTELSEARLRLQEAEATLHSATAHAGGATLEPNRLPALAAAVAAVQDSDHTARRRLAARTQARYQEELDDRLRTLLPWQGNIEQLAALAVPDDDDIRRWQAELSAAQNQHARREQELERAHAEQSRLAVQREAIARVTGVVSNQEATSIRAAREAAWAEHRRALDAASADAFEKVLRQDDIVMNARLQHEADVARLHQAGEALALANGNANHAQEEFDKARFRLQRIEDVTTAAAAPLLPNATLDRLKAWLGRRDKALDIRASLREATRDLHHADAAAEELRQRLSRALDAAGVAHDPVAAIDDLRVSAQAVLDREGTLKTLSDAVQERRRDVQVRERQFKKASEREAQWQVAWETACLASWLGESDMRPSVTAAQEMLKAVAELGPALDRRAGLLDRIEKMQADQQDYAAEVAAVAQLLGWSADGGAPLELARRIVSHVQDAQTMATLRASKALELESLHARQRDHTEAQRIHDSRVNEMQVFFGVCSLSDVAARLADGIRKSELQRQAEAAMQEIMDALYVSSIEEAEQRLECADRIALEAELAPLKAKFDDQDQRAHNLFSDFSKASDQIERVGGDSAVARLEEQRRTLLLDIEERAIRYLRQRAGTVAAEHALRSYRQKHRSTMMAEASDAFRTISGGAYSGLTTQPKKDGEDLIAVGADGSSKISWQLSKGTRFQLYLALRVAGYREFARLHPPVPFIADDIMETFDDERTKQALRLLGSIGEVGQAIYLTHHPHVCEIARQVCPDVRLHYL